MYFEGGADRISAGLDVHRENYPRSGLSKREEGATSDEAGPAAHRPQGELLCGLSKVAAARIWILERRPGWGWELGSWDPTALGSGAWTRPRGVSGAEEGKDGAQGAPGGGGREKRMEPGEEKGAWGSGQHGRRKPGLQPEAEN